MEPKMEEEEKDLTDLTYEDFKNALYNLFGKDNYKEYLSNFRKLEIKTVKRAFREKAKHSHPDKAAILGKNEKELEIKFKDINNSCQILVDLLNDKDNLK